MIKAKTLSTSEWGHYQCGSCSEWWAVEDGRKSAYFCSHCGVQNDCTHEPVRPDVSIHIDVKVTGLKEAKEAFGGTGPKTCQWGHVHHTKTCQRCTHEEPRAQILKDLDSCIVPGDNEMSDYNARQIVQECLIGLGCHDVVAAWDKVPRL